MQKIASIKLVTQILLNTNCSINEVIGKAKNIEVTNWVTTMVKVMR